MENVKTVELIIETTNKRKIKQFDFQIDAQTIFLNFLEIICYNFGINEEIISAISIYDPYYNFDKNIHTENCLKSFEKLGIDNGQIITIVVEDSIYD